MSQLTEEDFKATQTIFFYLFRFAESVIRVCQACLQLSRQARLWLIHYMGSENVYVPLPHGNMAKDTQEYHRTCPSVLTAVKKAIPSA